MHGASPDPVRERYVALLEDENEILRERVRQLEDMLGHRLTVPLIFGLTAHEGKMLGLLVSREGPASKEAILNALYGHLPPEDEPEIKIVDVYVCKARAKLKRFGVEIDTVWGRGYCMTPAAKAKVQEYLAAETGRVTA